MTVTTTTFEIWAIADGRIGNSPVDVCVSLTAAEKEAAYRARGDLLDTFQNRKPSRLIFILADGEVLRPDMADGLYIKKKVSISEPQYVG